MPNAPNSASRRASHIRRDILRRLALGLRDLVRGETQMAQYQIELTEDAKVDLDSYSAYERKIIVSEIRVQLSYQPLVETKNRKPLRENPIASWELRVGRFRVFYEVDDAARIVTVVSVGHKEHNVLLVRGKEVHI
jgi:mRNA-degrading endonuclease RelE of RelBE toxin-antitoxin system